MLDAEKIHDVKVRMANVASTCLYAKASEGFAIGGTPQDFQAMHSVWRTQSFRLGNESREEIV